MGLKVDIEKNSEGNQLTVSLTGSLDSDTYQEVEKKVLPLINASIKGVLLNMQGLTYISSIGFSVIFRAKQSVEKYGGTLVIANLQPNVKKIFDSVKVIPESIFATLQEADDYLDKFIAFINSQAKKNE